MSAPTTATTTAVTVPTDGDGDLSTDRALTRLRAVLAEIGPVVVGFSGGVDSTLVAWAARDVLGEAGALAATAVSPSLPSVERDACAALAASWDLPWVAVETDEMDRAAYRRNDADRCAHCKDALMDAIEPLARARGATTVLGVNVDDLGDHRPGQQVAAERGGRFPLVEADLTKAEVRRVSRSVGLATWDKPAAACLASRVPYGAPVTVAVLGQVGRAEHRLRALGFAALRVRHYDDLARIEVPVAELDRVVGLRGEVVAAVRGAGYRYVTLDLEGLRSGNLNDALTVPPESPDREEADGSDR